MGGRSGDDRRDFVYNGRRSRSQNRNGDYPFAVCHLSRMDWHSLFSRRDWRFVPYERGCRRPDRADRIAAVNFSGNNIPVESSEGKNKIIMTPSEIGVLLTAITALIVGIINAAGGVRKSDFETLRQTIETLQSENKRLSDQNALLRVDFDRLRGDKDRLQQANEELSEKIESLTGKVDSLENSNKLLKAENARLRSRIADLEKRERDVEHGNSGNGSDDDA